MADPVAPPAGELRALTNALVARSYSPGTLLAYRRTATSYVEFLHDLDLPDTLPAEPSALAMFAAFLYDQGKAASTIKSALCGLAWFHRMAGVADTTNSFLVKRVLVGIAKAAPPPVKLLPIGRDLLLVLLPRARSLGLSTFGLRLFKAVATLAYHGCLRIGEVTLSGSLKNTIGVKDVWFTPTGGELSLAIHLRDFKHAQTPRKVLLRQDCNPRVCAVACLAAYLQVRPTSGGPPLRHRGREPRKAGVVRGAAQGPG